MRPATTAWLARVRANAAPPGTTFVIVRGPAGSVAVTPDEIVGKSDDELLAFIVGRLKDSNISRTA
jgi:hypothetical protein